MGVSPSLGDLLSLYSRVPYNISMDIYMGIDPGLEGALAIIMDFGKNFNGGDTLTVDIIKMPLLGLKKDRTISCLNIATLLAEANPSYIMIEEAFSMPGHRGKTTFINYGEIRGMLKFWMEPFIKERIIEISPMAWKRKLKLLKAEKDASIELAEKLYPQYKQLLITGKKKDHNKAEALLLAHLCRENFKTS
jgi:hypothetical protein